MTLQTNLVSHLLIVFQLPTQILKQTDPKICYPATKFHISYFCCCVLCALPLGMEWFPAYGLVWDIPVIQARIICTCPSLDGRSNIIISVTWTLRDWCSYVFFTRSPSLRDRIHTPSRSLLGGAGILSRS